MLDEQLPQTRFQVDLMEKAMPAIKAIVFGDMYLVEGGYAKRLLDLGCKDVCLIDGLESPGFLQMRLENPSLDFLKGDFSNPHFMRAFDRKYDISVVFQILLHQAPLLGTLNLMLEKTRDKVLICQPMLRELSVPNGLVYLPGNPATDVLYPLGKTHESVNAFNVTKVNHHNWLWGMTRSFLVSALKGEGFEIIYEAEQGPVVADYFPANPNWYMWGCIAQRTYDTSENWSRLDDSRGLYTAPWN